MARDSGGIRWLVDSILLSARTYANPVTSFAAVLLLLLPIADALSADSSWMFPVNVQPRDNAAAIRLTAIGQFGLLRKARLNVPAHFHTGIDIVRPDTNYTDQPILPAHDGILISLIDRGPYSQIILEHARPTDTLWTVYEHLRVIQRQLGAQVTTRDTIAFFFNHTELDKHGWQFDHVHFEIMRERPLKISLTRTDPKRPFRTHGLICYTPAILNQRYHDPLQYLTMQSKRQN